MSMLKRAEEIAHIAHANDTDKAGKPYILHPIAVAEMMATEQQRIIAMLHDVVENHPELYSFEQLAKEGFAEKIIAALKCLTKNKGENYYDYIRRIADNDSAIDVKCADLAHNAELGRFQSPSAADKASAAKYDKMRQYLKGIRAFKAEFIREHPDSDLTKEPYKYILHRNLYACIRDDYRAFCATLAAVINAMSKSVYAGAIVNGRAKELGSFTEKCARKAVSYEQEIFKNMTDLCGVRVIVQTTDQVAAFCDIIGKYLDIDHSLNAGDRLGIREFGYQSYHYIVSVRQDMRNVLGVDIDVERFTQMDMKAEIQVRTLAQHIVSETDHDRLYKSVVKPLKEHYMDFSKIAAQATILDSMLNQFSEEYDLFSLNQASYVTVKKAEAEISILKAISIGEADIFTQFQNALTSTQYLRNLGYYAGIIETLEPFIDNEKLNLDTPQKAKLWYEYGFALLNNGNHDNSALTYLERAVKAYLEEKEKSLQARRFYVHMLTTAGIFADNEHWIKSALDADITNPYATAELLRYENVAAGLIHSAISVAKKHLESPSNEPEVYFVLGRLCLACQNVDAAFDYYADGLLFYLSKAIAEGPGDMRKNIRVKQILEREIRYLGENDIGTELGISALFACVFRNIYEIEPAQIHKTIWVFGENDVLNLSSKGYDICKFSGKTRSEHINEMSNKPGYLFLEIDDAILAKAALCLGLRVISSCVEMNNRLVSEEKIRKTKGFYTLPCEEASLIAVFASRKSAISEEQIEAAAQNAHEKYVKDKIAEIRKSGKSEGDIGERIAKWEKLDEKYKVANIDQVRYRSFLFEYAGYTLNTEPKNALTWDDLSVQEREKLAILEHGRWNAEKVTTGWCYHAKRDNDKLLHNCIVAWDMLTDEIKAYDFYAIKEAIDYYMSIGYYLHR